MNRIHRAFSSCGISHQSMELHGPSGGRSTWLAGATSDRLAAIEDYVRHYQEMGAFDGVVLVAEGDRVVYRRSFGNASYELDVPMRVDHRFRIASLSKQVTQALVGRMVDQKKLDPNAPISRVLPGFAHGEKITVTQLLRNTSGVPHTNGLEFGRLWLEAP